MILYQLVLTDVETENCFDIGVYSTAKKAKETAEYYQKHIPGFMSYPCKKEVLNGLVLEKCTMELFMLL